MDAGHIRRVLGWAVSDGVKKDLATRALHARAPWKAVFSIRITAPTLSLQLSEEVAGLSTAFNPA